MYIIAVSSQLCVTACMHVHSPHVGSVHNTWFHGDKINCQMFAPQHLRCSGDYDWFLSVCQFMKLYH